MSRQSSKPASAGSKRTHRTFSTEFKQTKVRQIEARIVTVSDVVREHEVSSTSVYKWIDRFGSRQKATQVVVQLESEEHRSRLLREELHELERVVGRKQIEIDYLQSLIEIGSQELGVDLKKTFGTRPSNTCDSSPTAEDGR
jgi:transposase-like protein